MDIQTILADFKEVMERWFALISYVDNEIQDAKSEVIAQITAQLNNKLNKSEYVIDTAINSTSTNPVQNKVINTALGKKANSSHTHSYLPLTGGTLTGTVTSNSNITASKFIKSGGTTSQFLKANGDVDSNSYALDSHIHTFGSDAGTYCEGNDSRLSDKRTPKSHATSATTYGVSSASNYGHSMASGTSPKMDGIATVGSETAKFARGDHIHPSDTTKVDKVSGKGLSTNDYTTIEKNKLAGIAENANNYSHPTTLSANTTNYSSNQTPSFGSTFNIPKLTFNTGGHLTTSANSTVKIPALPTASTSQAGIIQIGTGSSNACAGNDSRLSNKREPTSHASTGSSYGLSNATNYGHSMATTTIPIMDGTATLGSETAKFARGDHIHPSDTTKVNQASMVWEEITDHAVYNPGGVRLYANDYFCYITIDKSYSNITLSKSGDYGIQTGYISYDEYKPPFMVTTVSEVGTSGHEVIVKLTPDGDLYMRSLCDAYTGAVIVRCSLLYPRNIPKDT